MIKYLDLAIANETIKTTPIKGKDYAEVNQRIKAFRMVYPEGTIETEMISNENGMCVFRASVYIPEYVKQAKGMGVVIVEDKRLIATGTAYEKEDSSFINQTSYIENCETSAVGRALGMAGFGIEVSVASAEEVANAINNQVITQEDADKYKLKFGKYKDKTIKEIYKDDPKYIEWMITNTKDENLLKIISMTTGIYIPTPEEQEEILNLMKKLNDKVNDGELDIDDIKEKYKVNSTTELTIDQLKEIV